MSRVPKPNLAKFNSRSLAMTQSGRWARISKNECSSLELQQNAGTPPLPPSPSNTRQTRPRYVQPFVSGGAGIDNSLRFLADAPDWKIGAAQSCHLGVCIFVGRQLGLNSNPQSYRLQSNWTFYVCCLVSTRPSSRVIRSVGQ